LKERIFFPLSETKAVWKALFLTAVLLCISRLRVVVLCAWVSCGKIQFRRLRPVFLSSSFPGHIPFWILLLSQIPGDLPITSSLWLSCSIGEGLARPQSQKPNQLEDEGRIMGSLKAVQNHFIPFISCLKLYV